MHLPQNFNDAKDPVVTEEWFESLESFMTMFGITKQEKIRFTIYFFKFSVRLLCNLVQEKVKISKISQLEFRKRFESEYKRTNMTCIKAQEFITLTQAINSMKEYSNKFNYQDKCAYYHIRTH